jgi:hypothetical protein
MTTEIIQHQLQLRRLGWITIDDGQRTLDGRWSVLVMRDPRETIIALTDSRREAWSAAYSMAVRLTCKGLGSR